MSDPIGFDPMSTIRSNQIGSDIKDTISDRIGSDITDIESNQIRFNIGIRCNIERKSDVAKAVELVAIGPNIAA